MKTVITAERWHEIAAGHRVVGHHKKCKNLHGHAYLVTFTLEADLDEVGRVLDFGFIKTYLCEWLEENWDHRMILWDQDPLLEQLRAADPEVTAIPVNPTAENLAQYLLEVIGPAELRANAPGVRLVAVKVEETRKCSATARLSNG